MKTVKQRFLDKVLKTDSCWLWTAGGRGLGYGCFYFNQKMNQSHRVAWLLFKGSIPKNKLVLHKCDNPGCVNPKHLFLGTQKENVQDMLKKGRQRNFFGPRPCNSKLSKIQVLEIRRKYIPWKYGMWKLAKEYGVQAMAIHSIISRKTWKYLE